MFKKLTKINLIGFFGKKKQNNKITSIKKKTNK